MLVWGTHQSEDYFPDAQRFDTACWLNPNEVCRIEKVFVPFSKGSRACAGKNYISCALVKMYSNLTFSLPHFESYVTLGTELRHFGNLNLKNLTAEDLAYIDYFSAQTLWMQQSFTLLRRSIKLTALYLYRNSIL
jgi:hypothetical protein